MAFTNRRSIAVNEQSEFYLERLLGARAQSSGSPFNIWSLFIENIIER